MHGGMMSKRGSFNKELHDKNVNFSQMLAEKKKNINPEQVVATANEKPFLTIPGRMADLQDRKFLSEKVRELELALQQAKAAGGALEIDLDELHEVPGRRRILTAQQYNELKENLRNYPLASPITVEIRPEGGYFIVSGNNRVRIYRELGRKKIKAWLDEISGQIAEDLSFFANLLNTPLPDYEKFVGFKKFQERYPEMSQQDIANKVGCSKSLIGALFAFNDLPTEAISIIQDNPSIIGSTAAAQLASIAKKGRVTEVTNAIKQIADGKIDQSQAIKLVSNNGISKSPPAFTTTPFKIGASKYCTLRRAKNSFRIEFADETEAKAIETELHALIKNRIKGIKERKKETPDSGVL